MSKPESSKRAGIYPSIDPEQFRESLNGKVALVTGSGRGIGRHIAFALAKSGASAAITGRTKIQVDETREDLSKSFPDVKVIGIIGDVCKQADVEYVVEEVSTKLGDIDILINNAGTNKFMPFHITDAGEWWKQMEIKTGLHHTAYPEKTKIEAPYVIGMMGPRLHKFHTEFSIDLPAWTCVCLAAGNGSASKGRFVDCTRDLEEVTKFVESSPKPKITNACG